MIIIIITITIIIAATQGKRAADNHANKVSEQIKSDTKYATYLGCNVALFALFLIALLTVWFAIAMMVVT